MTLQKASNIPTGIVIDSKVKNLTETFWIFWIEKTAIAKIQLPKNKVFNILIFK